MSEQSSPEEVETERLRRWRLMLGAEDPGGARLSGEDQRMNDALAALYDNGSAGEQGSQRSAGLGRSAPRVNKWLGDIRSCFPNSVVQVMQRDAIERLDLKRLLLEPEVLDNIEPDVHLASTLIELSRLMPGAAQQRARQVVARVVEEIERRIAERTRSAVMGALNRASRIRRPRHSDVDWNRTIAANLKNYLPEHRTVVPERLVGHGRSRLGVQREVVLAIDQSGSMAESVVHSAVFGAVLAGIRALRTSVVVFDTSVVDLSDKLADAVEVLFSTQLGGGTDINRAVAYCSELITRPRDSLFVLVSDLYEGGVREELLQRMRALHASGVTVICLLSLSDSGKPFFDRDLAAELVELGIPAFACTPDVFPELLEVALAGGDVLGWSQQHEAARASTG